MYSNACKVVDGTIEITREAPAEKQGLADLWRQTRFLLTHDVCSLLNIEAIICRAVVVPMMVYPYGPEELEYPFGSIVNGSFCLLEDYCQKRSSFLSVITEFTLAS